MSENAKLIELESKIAFQDKAIEDLSDIIFQLDKKLTTMESKYESLRLKMTQLIQSEGLEVGQHDDKPPHY